MLVLSRKVGERIMIGDDVVITIIETRGNIIRIGIEAPREIEVYREEVYDNIQKEKEGVVSYE